jgi:hypothetical protein
MISDKSNLIVAKITEGRVSPWRDLCVHNIVLARKSMFSTLSIKAPENEIASLRPGKRYIATSGAQNAQPPKPKGY